MGGLAAAVFFFFFFFLNYFYFTFDPYMLHIILFWLDIIRLYYGFIVIFTQMTCFQRSCLHIHLHGLSARCKV